MEADYARMRIKKAIFLPDWMFFLRHVSREMSTVVRACEKTKIAYSHLYHIKTEFISNGWVIIRKEGFRHFLVLTDKGRIIASIINRIFDLLGYDDEKIKNQRILIQKNYSVKDKIYVEDIKDGNV